MKKFALVLLVVLAGCTVAFGQLSKTERKNRCETNRKQLDEYVQELKVVTMVENETKFNKASRLFDDLSSANLLGEVDDAIELLSVRRSYAVDWGIPWSEKYWTDARAFQIELTRKVENAVTRAKREGVAEMKSRAAWLLQQGKFHLDRMKELHCDELANEPDKPSPCSRVGEWRQTSTGIGGSTWTVTEDGTAVESGLGAAKGTATFSGNTMTINWTTKNGWAGKYEWTMTDPECTKGTGTLSFSAGGSGKRNSTVTHSQ